MKYADIEVILNSMKPADRFLFGLRYLYHIAKSKMTGEDMAELLLYTEMKRQVERTRRIEAGDYQA